MKSYTPCLTWNLIYTLSDMKSVIYTSSDMKSLVYTLCDMKSVMHSRITIKGFKGVVCVLVVVVVGALFLHV